MAERCPCSLQTTPFTTSTPSPTTRAPPWGDTTPPTARAPSPVSGTVSTTPGEAEHGTGLAAGSGQAGNPCQGSPVPRPHCSQHISPSPQCYPDVIQPHPQQRCLPTLLRAGQPILPHVASPASLGTPVAPCRASSSSFQSVAPQVQEGGEEERPRGGCSGRLEAARSRPQARTAQLRTEEGSPRQGRAQAAQAPPGCWHLFFALGYVLGLGFFFFFWCVIKILSKGLSRHGAACPIDSASTSATLGEHPDLGTQNSLPHPSWPLGTPVLLGRPRGLMNCSQPLPDTSEPPGKGRWPFGCLRPISGSTSPPAAPCTLLKAA